MVSESSKLHRKMAIIYFFSDLDDTWKTVAEEMDAISNVHKCVWLVEICLKRTW